MDADRSGDQVTESGVDRELQAMLAVDPSPEFVARVRTRIAIELPPSASWLSWKLAIAGALAAAVTVAVTLPRPKAAPRPERVEARAASGDVGRTTPPAAAVARTPAETQHREKYGPSASRRTGGPTAAARRETVVSAEPEVLIDVREARAIRAFIDNARNGRMEVAPFLSDPPPQLMEAQSLQDIYIAPIEFEPLTAGNSEKGVPQ
jgi:hypothetical protein